MFAKWDQNGNRTLHLHLCRGLSGFRSSRLSSWKVLSFEAWEACASKVDPGALEPTMNSPEE